MHLLVHLSDIHFSTTGSPFDKSRASAIATAIRSAALEIKSCTILVTGDVAHGGLEAEYERAFDFFCSLVDDIKRVTGLADVTVFFVPGNHDCNFTSDQSIRDAVLLSLDGSKSAPSPAVVETCLAVQHHFWSFASIFHDADSSSWKLSSSCSTCSVFRGYVGTLPVRITLLNSSWVSRRRETPGSLIPPPCDVTYEGQSPAIDIALIHHPYSWFAPSRLRDFRRDIELRYTLVLTGHEHEGDSFAISREAAETTFLAGELLSSESDGSSAFHIICLGPEIQDSVVKTFAWDGQKYAPKPERPLSGIQRAQFRNGHGCEITSVHQQFLQNPDFALNHPDCDKLELQHYFVYPNLRRLDSKERPGLKLPKISASLKLLTEDGPSLVFGPDTCGKTSLAKRLFCDALSEGYAPLLLRGPSILSASDARLHQLMQESYKSQYTSPDFDSWMQLPRDKRVLIIDDWHRTPLKKKERRHKILSIFCSAFSALVVISGEELQFESFETGEHSLDAFGFRHYQILPFGHQKRAALIDKWFSLYNNEDTSEEDIEHRRGATERDIDRIIGVNFVPSYPFYILLLLSQQDAQRPTNTSSGSYGHLYEALVTIAIERIKDSNVTLDTKLQYLTEFAHYLRTKASRTVSMTEVQAFHDAHCTKYLLILPFTTLLGELIKSGVLTSSHDSIGFRHRFTRYYFVGRYLRDHINETTTREAVAVMTRRLHNTESANVLIFLCYLCKEPFILETMLSSSKALFAGHAPCDMTEDTRILTNLLGYAPGIRVRLPPGTAREHRESLALARDRSRSAPRGEDSESESLSDTDGDDAQNGSEIVQFSAALKTITILGQVLRNFAGSIQGETKHDIACECYSLGMRVLGFFVSGAKNNQQELLDTVTKAFSARKDLAQSIAPEELDTQVRVFLFWLFTQLAYILTRHVAYSVGLRDLQLTFDQVLERQRTTSTSLIDLAIRLECFRGFPQSRIEALHKNEKKNAFAHAVLANLVATHLHLNSVDFRAKQTVCKLLGIQTSAHSVQSQNLLPKH